MDTIEDLVSKNASGDELKNALRGISERQIPTELKRTLSDRLHQHPSRTDGHADEAKIRSDA